MSRLGPVAGGAVAIVLGAIAVATIRAAGRADPGELAPRTLALLLGGMWVATGIRIARLAPLTMPQTMVLALGTLAAVVACVRPPRAARLAAGAFAFGAALRMASYAALPLDPLRADMLPVIREAIDRLRVGSPPYGIYAMPSWEVPLVYLPGTWLAYAPARLAGLDLRLTNLVVELGLAAWVARLGAPRGAALGLCAVLYLSPSVLPWSVNTEHPIFWLALAFALGTALSGRRLVLPALALGLAGGVSPLAAVVAPFIGIRWVRQHGLARAAGGAGLAALTAAAILLPFLVWDPGAFLHGAFRWHNDNTLFPAIKWAQEQTWARQIGFAGLAWHAGAVEVLKPLQAAALVALAVAYAQRGARAVELAPFCSLAVVVFVALNPMNWLYLYWPGVIASLVGEATATRVRS